MTFKRQLLGLTLLLLLSALSAVFWVINAEKEHDYDRVIQASSNLKFLLKDIRVIVYRSNVEVNNDEISIALENIDKGLENLLMKVKFQEEKYSQQDYVLLQKKVTSFKYKIQKYQSSHALIKNSVAHVRKRHALVLASHPKEGKAEVEYIKNVLFDYYADALEPCDFTYKSSGVDSTAKRLLFLHVRQIFKQYAQIEILQEGMDNLSEEILQFSQECISISEHEIEEIKKTNKMMFISFVVTTIWLLLYGFSSFVRAKKDFVKIRSLKNSLQQFVDALNRSAIVSKSDPYGVITYVNDKFVKVSGYSKEELIGQPHNIVRHEDMPKTFFKELWSEIRSNKTFHALIKNKRKDGNPYYVDTHISAILNVEGEVEEYVAVRYDVTELVDARDKALSAQRVKDKFLSTMSHELRTPLNSVIGFSGILQKTLEDSAHKIYINNVVESAHDLLRLINDILDLAKIQGGEFMIIKARFNVQSSFRKLSDIYTTQALSSDKSFTYVCEVDKALDLRGDWLRISQVLSNLLSNAMKFTNAQGEVTFRISYNNAELCMSVQDTGIGMSEEGLKKIFMPFTQIDDETTRAYGGSGLGLSISKGLLEMMGGRLEVESTLNEGSTFSAYLPLEECETKASEDINKTLEATLQFKGHVLVVEDNVTNQLMLGMLLEEHGISSDVAENGKIAVDMYEEGKYDLVLMDENMPVMGGTEAMLRLRKLHKDLVPIIVVTANVMSGDREKFLKEGMDDYIAKPVDDATLQKVLQKYLEKV